jgi:hypothetical protein
MSRFGWAYVNGLVTSSVARGPTYAIQFNSGSNIITGSSNLIFDYTTNELIVTGNVKVIGQVSSSTSLLTAGTIQAGSNITSNGIISSSGGLNTGGGIIASTSITSTGGILSSSTGVQTAGAITSQSIISSSLGFQTNSTVTAVSNITSTSGLVSASSGLYSGDVLNVAGVSNLKNNLIVTGNVNISGTLVSTSTIQAAGFIGDGLNITGIQGSNVYGVGNDWTVQFKNGITGVLTGSSALTVSASSTPGLFLTQFSSSGVVQSSVVRSTNRTLNDGDYYLFFSSSSPLTATLGSSITGREVILSNYGTAELLITGSTGVVGFITTAGSNVQSVIIGGAGARTLKFVYLSNNGRWMAV